MTRTEAGIALGQVLKRLRCEKSWTVVTAAAAMGVSVQTIYNWETGDKMPGNKRYTQLAKTYGAREDDLRAVGQRPRKI